METRANYVIVGIFTLAAILAAFGFVYWTAGIGERGEVAQLRVRIPGSAAGLGRGSLVLFNGVKVGEVRRVYFDVNNPSVAIADAVIDRLTPITRSTLADVGLAGLTGQANIELRGGDPAEPNLLAEADIEGVIAEVEANPSLVTNLLETAQTILQRADAVLVELEGFAADARGPLTETVRNVEQFSAALGRNAEGIDTFLESVSAMSETFADVSGNLEGTLSAAEGLLRSVDHEQVARAMTNLEVFTQRLEQASGGFDEIMGGVDQAVLSIGRFSDSANETLARLDGLMAEVEPGSVGSAVTNFREASAEINAAAADIARFTATVGERGGDIDQIITDVREMAGRLNQSSGRVDGVIARVDALLAEDGPAGGLLVEAGETLRAYREVAESASARVESVFARVDALLAEEGPAGGLISDASEALRAYREVAESVSARVEGVLARVDALVAEVEPGSVGAVVASFREASTEINAAAADIARFAATVGERGGDVDQIIADVRQMTGRLNQSWERVDGVIARVDAMLAEEGPAGGLLAEATETLRAYREVAESASARVESVLARVDGLMAEVEPGAVGTAVANFSEASAGVNAAAADIARFTADVRARTGDIDRIITDVREMAERLNQSSTQVNSVIARVDALLADEGAAGGLISDASETLRAYREVAETVNVRIDGVLSQFEGLLGSGEAEGVIADASETLKAYRDLADTVNDRIGGVLERVDTLLASGEAENVFADVSATLAAFREVAETLNTRLGPITEGLARFSGQGLREVEGLIRDSRQAIVRIERAITDLERNPQRILTGGEGSVREFDGRARR